VKHVRQRVKDYPVYVNAGPGKDEADVSLITLGFSFEQAGWYSLVFDTRPDAAPDGEWQGYIEENAIDTPVWCLDDVPQVNIMHYDERWKPPKRPLTDEYIAKLFGKMMRDVLLHSRKQSVFKRLPLAANCALSVEEHEGRYGWPNYEALRTTGRAIQ
jgi:hypothetical protein